MKGGLDEVTDSKGRQRTRDAHFRSFLQLRAVDHSDAVSITHCNMCFRSSEGHNTSGRRVLPVAEQRFAASMASCANKHSSRTARESRNILRETTLNASKNRERGYLEFFVGRIGIQSSHSFVSKRCCVFPDPSSYVSSEHRAHSDSCVDHLHAYPTKMSP